MGQPVKADKLDVRRERGIRPLWVLVGGMPRPAESAARGKLGAATHYCREGDARWRPIADLEFREEGAGAGAGEKPPVDLP